MKFVSNLLNKKSNVMWVLILCFFISCGVKSTLPKTIKADNLYTTTLPIYHEIAIPVLKKQDTVRTKQTYRHDPVFQEKLNHLIERSDKAFNSIDEILSINVEWQKRYMRVADTARNRKKGKDSLYLIVLSLRDSTIAFNKRNQKYFEIVKKANHFENRVISEDNWYKWFMIVCVGGTFVSTIITWLRRDKIGS